MFKRVEVVPKMHNYEKNNNPYVRITPKAIYINEGAAQMLDGDYIQIEIDSESELVRFLSCKKGDEHAFKLSSVCETEHAKRIETNNVMFSLLKAGFDMNKMYKKLNVLRIKNGILFSYD